MNHRAAAVRERAAQQHQPRRHFRAETEQAAVEGHLLAWKQAAGGGQRGHRGFLQERIDAPLFVGHIYAVAGAALGRLSMATPHTPGLLQSIPAASKVRITSPEPTTRPARQPLHPGGGKGQHFVEHRAGFAPGSLHRHRAEQFAGERVLRKARESPPEWIMSTRCPAATSFRDCRKPPRIRPPGRPARAGWRRRFRSAGLRNPAPRDRPCRRDPALRLTPAQFRFVALGLPPGTGRDHHGRPPRSRRPGAGHARRIEAPGSVGYRGEPIAGIHALLNGFHRPRPSRIPAASPRPPRPSESVRDGRPPAFCSPCGGMRS